MEVPPSTTPATPEISVPVSEGNTISETSPGEVDAKTSGQQFQLDTTHTHIVVVCGDSGSGKSYSTCALLKTLFQQGILKWIRIYSHTVAANHEYD